MDFPICHFLRRICREIARARHNSVIAAPVPQQHPWGCSTCILTYYKNMTGKAEIYFAVFFPYSFCPSAASANFVNTGSAALFCKD